MYIWILCIVRSSIIANFQRSLRYMDTSGGQTEIMENERQNVQLRLVRVFVAILTANLLTWLPMIASALTGAIVRSGRIPTLMYTFAYLSFLSETVIHPILEACLIREVRVTMSSSFGFCRRKIKWCRGGKGDSSNLRANTMSPWYHQNPHSSS